MLILCDRKEYPDARDILKVFRCLGLRNRKYFGECMSASSDKKERGRTYSGGPFGGNWSVSLDTELDIPRVYIHAFLFPPKGGGIVSLLHVGCLVRGDGIIQNVVHVHSSTPSLETCKYERIQLEKLSYQ